MKFVGLAVFSASLLCASVAGAQGMGGGGSPILWNDLDEAVHEIADLHETTSGGTLFEQPQLFTGDLDSDGDGDVAVFYTLEGGRNPPGGNVWDQFLAILLREGSGWIFAGYEHVGSKGTRSAKVVDIDEGIIWLETSEYDEDDPACCPSIIGRTRYRLQYSLNELD